MAGYGADYVSDFGNVYRCVRLNSRLVRASGLNSRTRSSFDLPYLPSIYLATVEPNAKSCCALTFTPRAVRLYLDEADYLYLQHPFQPTTANYTTFVSQLNSNSLILAVEHIGEKLTDFYTDYLTRNG